MEIVPIKQVASHLPRTKTEGDCALDCCYPRPNSPTQPTSAQLSGPPISGLPCSLLSSYWPSSLVAVSSTPLPPVSAPVFG